LKECLVVIFAWLCFLAIIAPWRIKLRTLFIGIALNEEVVADYTKAPEHVRRVL
jgi:hypothetical protein